MKLIAFRKMKKKIIRNEQRIGLVEKKTYQIRFNLFLIYFLKELFTIC